MSSSMNNNLTSWVNVECVQGIVARKRQAGAKQVDHVRKSCFCEEVKGEPSNPKCWSCPKRIRK